VRVPRQPGPEQEKQAAAGIRHHGVEQEPPGDVAEDQGEVIQPFFDQDVLTDGLRSICQTGMIAKQSLMFMQKRNLLQKM
jgi:hypothetical protein